MEKNKKHLIIAGIAIVVVVGLAIALPHLKKGTSAPAADATATATDTADKQGSQASGTGNASQGTWDAMLAKYSGRVIVFGADCNATPTDHVQGLGSTVLLANNSNVSHTVSVGTGSGMTIGAYHYKTVKIATSSIQVVSCDSNPKAATITVK